MSLITTFRRRRSFSRKRRRSWRQSPPVIHIGCGWYTGLLD